MALDEDSSRTARNAVETPSVEAARLAERLAPPEEQAAVQSAKNGGALIVDGGGKLPKMFVEEETTGVKQFIPDRAVIVIVAVALIFIAFIAWQISLMEPPAN